MRWPVSPVGRRGVWVPRSFDASWKRSPGGGGGGGGEVGGSGWLSSLRGGVRQSTVGKLDKWGAWKSLMTRARASLPRSPSSWGAPSMPAALHGSRPGAASRSGAARRSARRRSPCCDEASRLKRQRLPPARSEARLARGGPSRRRPSHRGGVGWGELPPTDHPPPLQNGHRCGCRAGGGGADCEADTGGKVGQATRRGQKKNTPVQKYDRQRSAGLNKPRLWM